MKHIGAGYGLFGCMGGICKQGKASDEAQRSQIMVRSPMLFFDFCPLMGLYSEITEVHPPHYCACLCGLRPYPSRLWDP